MTTTQIQTWEYKNIRFQFLGRGRTQEFQTLDVDGAKVMGQITGRNRGMLRLPELMNALGAEGWELLSHTLTNDHHDRHREDKNSLHTMIFKRPGKVEVATTAFSDLVGSAQCDQGDRLGDTPKWVESLTKWTEDQNQKASEATEQKAAVGREPWE